MDNLLSNASPAIQTIVAYISYFISTIKSFFNLFTFATGVSVLPEEEAEGNND